MKNFINQFKDFRLNQEATKFLDPNPKPKFCYNPVTGSYFTAYYFSAKYINEIQGCEVIYG